MGTEYRVLRLTRILIISQYFWPEYFRVNGAKLTGATLPDFDDELDIDDILDNLGNENFTVQTTHNNYTIRITVEDNKKNFAVREFTLNVSAEAVVF